MRILFALTGLVLAGGMFFFYTKPTYDALQATRDQIAQYNSALAKATELQQLKQTLLSRYNSFDPQDLARLQNMLPDSVDNIGLILDLDNLARRHGLALENVYTSTPSNVSSASTPISAIGGSGKKYDSLTLKFSTNGTYDNFLKFLADLEASLRIVEITSLSLAAGDATQAASAGGASAPVYQYDITLRTYWLK
ncbi:MAG: type 4a pilus biogenesis protein PilO [bacterium]|nr:type 4a pilus biogenesis protein PilO [bacterium]